jgi:hypothetical protein
MNNTMQYLDNFSQVLSYLCEMARMMEMNTEGLIIVNNVKVYLDLALASWACSKD